MQRLFVSFCVLMLAGCGDASNGSLGDGSTSLEDMKQDASAEDTTPFQDATSQDTAKPDTQITDASMIDTASQDNWAASLCEPGEGCFGESCSSPDDCLSGICTMHLGDKVCSKTCDEACPQGFTCTLVGSGGDGSYVCLSDFSHLCLPCSDAGTCSGETPNACVKYADSTRFCGGACDLENPCPSGYACQEVDTSDGVTSYQCVNTAGVCPCSNLAIESALATPCTVSNDHGSCQGVRACDETGLTACSASEPTAETCNGVDDDCNGLTDEGTCDDGNACTVDACNGAEGCSHTPLTGDECLDGDICTVTDHCEDGVCVGQPVTCDDDNPCTVDSCDGLGGCQHDPASALCDDGEPCTVGDVCKDGVCAGSVTLDCDDGNPCTEDSCGDSGCVFDATTEPCNDGNACTEGDACNQGLCSGNQVTCDDGNLCTTDSCDFDTGCVHLANEQPCDDNDVCSLQDACADGSCASGAVSLVCQDGNPCTDDACDAVLGCVFTANTADCDDTNSCTTGDSCAGGNCIGLGDLSCDDNNPCTEDICEADGGCEHTFIAGTCNDGDACTVKDVCINGACVSGESLSCDDGNLCTDDECLEGECSFSANELPCDDGNACTSASECQDGLCAVAEILDCDDANPCTSDACGAATGCIHVHNANPCSDSDPCTLGDACGDGSCQSGGQTLPCDDGNACTDDACEQGVGCSFLPNSISCDDGNACTDDSSCKNGSCVASVMVTCDDGNACTDDVCDVEQGCLFTANSAPCEDGDACSVSDSCVDGDCEAGADILDCDDGLFCNGEESCKANQGCVAGPQPSFDDGVACTVESCDEATDSVVSTPDDSLCDEQANGPCEAAVCDPADGCKMVTANNCCGNGIVEGAEHCDGSPGCGADCTLPKSCKAISLDDPSSQDGAYVIDPDGPGGIDSLEVFCDMTTDGGGWTYVARGSNGSTQINGSYGSVQTDPSKPSQWHLSMDVINAIAGSPPYMTYVTMGLNTGEGGSVDAGEYRVRRENQPMTFEQPMFDYFAWNGSDWVTSVALGNDTDRGPSWEPDAANFCCNREPDGSWFSCNKAPVNQEGQWSNTNTNQHLRCKVDTNVHDGLILFVR